VLNALVLYRFSSPDASRFVSRALVPSAARHFRVITISAASDEPGTIDYWLNAFYLADWLADIVISVTVSRETLSHNIVTEQLSLLAGARGLNNKTTLMRMFGLEPGEDSEFGNLYRVTISDAPAWRLRAAEVSAQSAHLHVSSVDPGGFDPIGLDRFLDEIAAVCLRADDRFARKYPKYHKRLMRIRRLFEEDDVVRRNLIFHNQEDDGSGDEPDPQDEGLRKFVKAMIHGDKGEDPPYKVLKVRLMDAHGQFSQDSFLGFSAKVGMALAGWLPSSFFNQNRNVVLFRALATTATLVAWPFYVVSRRLSSRR